MPAHSLHFPRRFPGPARPDMRGGLFFCVALALSWLAVGARAMDPFEYDANLVRALVRIGMYDYAIRQVQSMKREYPARGEDVLMAEVRVLLATGNFEQAKTLLARLPKTSPNFTRAQLLLAEAAVRRGRLDAAAKAYAAFFAEHRRPLGPSKTARREFRNAVQRYAAILRNQGKPREAARILDYLAAIPGAGVSKRQLAFLKAQAVLATEDKKARQGKPIDRKAIQNAGTALEGLQWQAVDAVAAAGIVEAAHADVLLGRYSDAITALQGAEEILAKVEEVLRKKHKRNASPLAGAHFYLGKALEGRALAELAAKGKAKKKKTNRAQARKDLTAALAHFYRVTKVYPGSPYAEQALAEFGTCKKLLKDKFGVHVYVKGGMAAQLRLRLRQAAAFYEAHKFEDALPIYHHLVQALWGDPEFPPAAARLVGCYARTKRFYEAEAVADALADAWPRSPQTADALLRLGALLYKASKTTADPARKQQWQADSARAWSRFVQLAPTHPKAPEIAFFVAEQAYKQAVDKAAIAKRLSGKKARAKATREARTLYQAAIPLYRRVATLCGDTPQGVRAWYKLGWIHYTLGDKAEAAGAFARYAEKESAPNRLSDRLEAKFRAAECRMFSGKPEEAIPHLEELLAWTAPGNALGINPNDPKVRKKQEQAANYLGWAWDLAAEQFRPKIQKIQDEIHRIDQKIDQLNQQLDGLEKQRRAVTEEKTAAEKAYQERLRQAHSSTAAALAEAEAKARGEKLEGLSPAEKAVAMRDAQARVQRLKRRLSRQEKERIAGEKIQLEQERERLKTERAALQSSLNAFEPRGGPKARASATGRRTKSKRREKTEKTRLRLQLDFVTARLAAVALALRLNQKEQSLATAPPERRTALESALAKLRAQTLEAFTTAWKQRQAYLQYVEKTLKKQIAAIRRRLRSAKKRRAELEKQLAPLEREFRKRKESAREKFEEFVRTWPKSNLLPDTLARLGTIYVELNQYRKASETFTTLARKYPDSKAARKAFFDLGRAECELGHWDKAEAAFQKLLKQPEKQPLAVLLYISGKMFEAGRPKTSLAAAREILRRSSTPPGSQAAAPYVRENALFRAGEDCFLLKQYAQALKFYATLLKERPDTAYYFTVKLHSGLARRKIRPPDYKAALNDFGEIVLYAKDPALVNHALCEMGATYEKMGGPANLRLALARYQQVAMLADPKITANRPWIERALYRSAVLAKRLGDPVAAQKAAARCLHDFPAGPHAGKLRALAGPAPGPTPQKPEKPKP